MIVPLANQLLTFFEEVVATQDWHPADHGSFASQYEGKVPGEQVVLQGVQQILWPDHCVQASQGAALHPALETSQIQKIFHKGTDKNIDSYSAFYDNAHLKETGLAAYLHERGIDTIYVMGLATDYCVKFTCLDAIQLQFKVCLLLDACRGINLQPNDVSDAVAAMQAVGVKIMHVADVLLK